MVAALFACSPAETEVEPNGTNGVQITEVTPTPTLNAQITAPAAPALAELVLYLPDKTGVGLVATVAQGEDSPQGLLSALVAADALPDVDYGKNITCTVAEDELVYEDLTYVGKFVHLDLSDAFAEAVKMVDAEEEKLILQSLVDTFVTHYQADALVLSIAGTDLETVSNRYDRPIAFDELVKTRVFACPTP